MHALTTSRLHAIQGASCILLRSLHVRLDKQWTNCYRRCKLDVMLLSFLCEPFTSKPPAVPLLLL